MSALPKGILCKMSCAIVYQEGYKPIECIMFYSEENPFEVVFAAHQETENGEEVEWHYSRELLAQAMNGDFDHSYGDGDVQFFKADQFIYTLFSQGNAKCLVAFMVADMRIFLDSTLEIVPLGAETVNIDQELQDFLGEN